MFGSGCTPSSVCITLLSYIHYSYVFVGVVYCFHIFICWIPCSFFLFSPEGLLTMFRQIYFCYHKADDGRSKSAKTCQNLFKGEKEEYTRDLTYKNMKTVYIIKLYNFWSTVQELVYFYFLWSTLRSCSYYLCQ